MFDERAKCLFNNCLLDFRDSSSSSVDSFLLVLLEKLLEFRGVGLEMSGVYLSADEDAESVPDYLTGKDSMAFEFMGEHVVCSLPEGAFAIKKWCEKNAILDREIVLGKCKRLFDLYSAT